MENKFLNFSIAETSGRTFEIPLEELVRIVNKMKEDNDELKDVDVDFSSPYSMASFVNLYGMDEFSEYELSNDYFDTSIAEANII